MHSSTLTYGHEHAEPAMQNSMRDHERNLALPCTHCQVGHTCILWTHIHQHSPVQTATTLFSREQCNQLTVNVETQYIGILATIPYSKHASDAEARYTGTICAVSYQQNDIASRVQKYKCI